MLGVGQQVAVALHDALGQAGRAAGVRDGSQRVGRECGEIGMGRIEGRRRAQVVPVNPAFGREPVPGEYKKLDTTAATLQLTGHFKVRAVSHKSAYGTVVDDEFQLGHRQPVVQVVEHHSGRRYTHPAFEVAVGILSDSAHDIAVAQADIAQSRRKTVNAAAPLGVGEPDRAINDGFTGRVRCQRAS